MLHPTSHRLRSKKSCFLVKGLTKMRFLRFITVFFAKHFVGVDAKFQSMNIGDEECQIIGQVLSLLDISHSNCKSFVHAFPDRESK